MYRQTLQFRKIAFGLLFLLSTALFLLTSTNAAADAANQGQAVQMALQRSGGDSKVLSVNTEKSSDGSVVYAVKVLSNGRVRVFRIPKSR